MTDLDIAKFYGVSTRTISNYKNGNKKKKALYNAMKYFLEYPPRNKQFTNMSIKELHYAHEQITTKLQNDIDSLQIIADFIWDRMNLPN